MSALLDIRHVSKQFHLRRNSRLYAVNGVSLTIAAGEVCCVVGESGCGKSTLARLIVGLHDPSGGEIYFNGERLDNLSVAARRPYRRALQMIFQNPHESLNPRMTIRQTLEEALRFHFPDLDRGKRLARMETVLSECGLDNDVLPRYPHQFSGGQRQRISIARALIVRPQCIIADEPIAALDVSVQAQILNLLADLRDEHHLAYLFITHDLSVVERFAQRVAVMYLGKFCEVATTQHIFARPRHPYTQILLQAAPRIGKPFVATKLPGEPPTPLSLPSGCAFHGRCPHANQRCQTEEPRLRQVGDSTVACHAVEEARI